MDIDRELAQHHKATRLAIEAGRVELDERRLKAYVSFAQAFLDAAGKRGITFSLGAIRSLMDWRTSSEIINYAWDGILDAVKSGNKELILAAADVPIRFMKISVEKRDFLFYQKMSQVYPAILATSYVTHLASNRDLLVDLSWRRLLLFADYFLPKLTATHDQKIREQFTSELLWRFGDLMKVAMDHSDATTFAAIGTAMDSLFHDLEIRGLPKEAASSLEEFVTQEKSLVWFGFGAWILRSFILKDMSREPGSPNPRLIDPGQIGAFFEFVSREFPNIKQLAGVYERALACKHGLSTWEGWLMDTLPERQVHSIDFGRWMTYFYVAMGLRLSKTGNPAEADIPAPFRYLEFRMNNIRENVRQIKVDQESWKVLIPQLAAKPTTGNADDTFWEYLLSANDAAVKEWIRLREDEVIASTIDPQRVKTFQEQCLKGWHETSWLVTVLTSARQSIEKIAEPKSTYLVVDEQLVPKDEFIASSDMPFVGWGHDRGAALGRRISTEILSLIEHNAVDAEGADAGSAVDKTLKVIPSISTEGSSIAVFVVGDFDLERQFLAAPGFFPRWTQAKPRFNFHEYIGDMGSVPVFFIFDRQSSRITVVDLAKVGKLVVYSPPENNVGGLLIRITAIDEAEADRLIENRPKFLQGSDGSTRTREAAVRDLRLKVRVFVGVKIELEIEASDAIRKVSIR